MGVDPSMLSGCGVSDTGRVWTQQYWVGVDPAAGLRTRPTRVCLALAGGCQVWSSARLKCRAPPLHTHGLHTHGRVMLCVQPYAPCCGPCAGRWSHTQAAGAGGLSGRSYSRWPVPHAPHPTPDAPRCMPCAGKWSHTQAAGGLSGRSYSRWPVPHAPHPTPDAPRCVPCAGKWSHTQAAGSLRGRSCSRRASLEDVSAAGPVLTPCWWGRQWRTGENGGKGENGGRDGGLPTPQHQDLTGRSHTAWCDVWRFVVAAPTLACGSSGRTLDSTRCRCCTATLCFKAALWLTAALCFMAGLWFTAALCFMAALCCAAALCCMTARCWRSRVVPQTLGIVACCSP
eukprot:365897-Chlamydomonas_euryale.AAC.3